MPINMSVKPLKCVASKTWHSEGNCSKSLSHWVIESVSQWGKGWIMETLYIYNCSRLDRGFAGGAAWGSLPAAAEQPQDRAG